MQLPFANDPSIRAVQDWKFADLLLWYKRYIGTALILHIQHAAGTYV